MLAADAALGERARIAEVLAAGAAGHAIRVSARPPHGWHYQIARLKAIRAVAGLYNLTERFMSQHQIFGPFGRRAVFEIADLAIRSTHAHLEHADFDLFGRGNLRLIERD